MSEVNRPWWFSGDEAPEPASDRAPSDPAQTPAAPTDGASMDWASMDWGGLVMGAQRLVDWATEKVMAPHAEHEDPREHPQCVVCRAMVLLGDRAAQAAPPPTPPPAGEIAWIPILGESSTP